MISLLAENEKDMQEWINILTAVAGSDATPIRVTQVPYRTVPYRTVPYRTVPYRIDSMYAFCVYMCTV